MALQAIAPAIERGLRGSLHIDGTGQRQDELAAWGDRVFWMVELMESRFLADREAVKRYYNDDRFQESSPPAKAQVEEISK